MTLLQVQEVLRLEDSDMARDALRFWQRKGVLAITSTGVDPAYPAYLPGFESEDMQWTIVERLDDKAADAKTSGMLPR